MREKTVIMDFSGIYRQEAFYEGKEYVWLDCSRLEGVNCCCTTEAEEEIKAQIAKFTFPGIHFLDSGNYHYLTKFWMDKIQDPFDLLVFDNHTDMQESGFFGLLSCGSWVKESLESHPFLQEICIMGPAEVSFLQDMKEEAQRVTPVSSETLSKSGLGVLSEFLERHPRRPLYISVDKDMLSSAYARTNWDQGETSLEDLYLWLKTAFEKREIAGVDICGENPQDTAAPPKGEELEINSNTNKSLWEFLEKEWDRQEKKEESKQEAE